MPFRWKTNTQSKINGKKVIASTMAVILLYSTVASPLSEASFWKERQTAARAMKDTSAGSAPLYASLPVNSPALIDALPAVSSAEALARIQTLGGGSEIPSDDTTSGKSERVPSWLMRLPPAYGDIQKVVRAKSDRPAPLVVLVQDAHGIYSAQKNIAGILDHMQKSLADAAERNSAPLLVGVEGSIGGFDLEPYRSFRDLESHGPVSDYLLRKGFIAGAEYFGITSDREPLLWGIEDDVPYIANVEAYQQSEPRKEDFTRLIRQFETSLDPVKQKLLTPALLSLDMDLDSYQKGELDLLSYVNRLTADGHALNGGFPQTRLLLKALAFEKSMDFKAVEAERKMLIEVLSRRLQKKDLDDLIAASVAYRSNQITYSGYYDFLARMTERNGLRLQNYPAFQKYIQYVLSTEQIDRFALFDEVDRLKDVAVSRLSPTSEQAEVLRVSQDIRLLARLKDFEFSPAEWSSYLKRRSQIARIPGRIAAAGNKPGRESNVGDDTRQQEAFISLLSSFEAFYGRAFERNDHLVRNLLAKARETNSGTVALVAGGFHTAALQEQFKSEGASSVIVTPKMTVAAGQKGSEYLNVFSQNRTPLEKLLLGEKLHVAAAGALNQAVRHEGGALHQKFWESGDLADVSYAVRTAVFAFLSGIFQSVKIRLQTAFGILILSAEKTIKSGVTWVTVRLAKRGRPAREVSLATVPSSVGAGALPAEMLLETPGDIGPHTMATASPARLGWRTTLELMVLRPLKNVTAFLRSAVLMKAILPIPSAVLLKLSEVPATSWLRLRKNRLPRAVLSNADQFAGYVTQLIDEIADSYPDEEILGVRDLAKTNFRLVDNLPSLGSHFNGAIDINAILMPDRLPSGGNALGQRVAAKLTLYHEMLHLARWRARSPEAARDPYADLAEEIEVVFAEIAYLDFLSEDERAAFFRYIGETFRINNIAYERMVNDVRALIDHGGSQALSEDKLTSAISRRISRFILDVDRGAVGDERHFKSVDMRTINGRRAVSSSAQVVDRYLSEKKQSKVDASSSENAFAQSYSANLWAYELGGQFPGLNWINRVLLLPSLVAEEVVAHWFIGKIIGRVLAFGVQFIMTTELMGVRIDKKATSFWKAFILLIGPVSNVFLIALSAVFLATRPDPLVGFFLAWLLVSSVVKFFVDPRGWVFRTGDFYEGFIHARQFVRSYATSSHSTRRIIGAPHLFGTVALPKPTLASSGHLFRKLNLKSLAIPQKRQIARYSIYAFLTYALVIAIQEAPLFVVLLVPVYAVSIASTYLLTRDFRLVQELPFKTLLYRFWISRVATILFGVSLLWLSITYLLATYQFGSVYGATVIKLVSLVSWGGIAVGTLIIGAVVINILRMLRNSSARLKRQAQTKSLRWISFPLILVVISLFAGVAGLNSWIAHSPLDPLRDTRRVVSLPLQLLNGISNTADLDVAGVTSTHGPLDTINMQLQGAIPGVEYDFDITQVPMNSSQYRLELVTQVGGVSSARYLYDASGAVALINGGLTTRDDDGTYHPIGLTVVNGTQVVGYDEEYAELIAGHAVLIVYDTGVSELILRDQFPSFAQSHYDAATNTWPGIRLARQLGPVTIWDGQVRQAAIESITELEDNRSWTIYAGTDRGDILFITSAYQPPIGASAFSSVTGPSMLQVANVLAGMTLPDGSKVMWALHGDGGGISQQIVQTTDGVQRYGAALDGFLNDAFVVIDTALETQETELAGDIHSMLAGSQTTQSVYNYMISQIDENPRIRVRQVLFQLALLDVDEAAAVAMLLPDDEILTMILNDMTLMRPGYSELSTAMSEPVARAILNPEIDIAPLVTLIQNNLAWQWADPAGAERAVLALCANHPAAGMRLLSALNVDSRTRLNFNVVRPALETAIEIQNEMKSDPVDMDAVMDNLESLGSDWYSFRFVYPTIKPIIVDLIAADPRRMAELLNGWGYDDSYQYLLNEIYSNLLSSSPEVARLFYDNLSDDYQMHINTIDQGSTTSSTASSSSDFAITPLPVSASAPQIVTNSSAADSSVTQLSVDGQPLAGDMLDLQNQVLAFIGDRPGTIGVNIYDMSTGRGFSINGGRPMPAGSLIHLPVLISILSDVQAGRLDLDDVTDSRIRAMMQHHNMDMTYLLVDAVGIDRVNAYVQAWGLPRTFMEHYLDIDSSLSNNVAAVDSSWAYLDESNLTTPDDMFAILRRLYAGELLNPQMTQVALDYLSLESIDLMIPRGMANVSEPFDSIIHRVDIIPPDGGNELYETYGDVAIVTTADGRVFFVSLMYHQAGGEIRGEAALQQLAGVIGGVISEMAAPTDDVASTPTITPTPTPTQAHTDMQVLNLSTNLGQQVTRFGVELPISIEMETALAQTNIYASDTAGVTAVTVMDLSTGEGFSVNGDRPIPLASTIHTIVLAAVLEDAQNGDLIIGSATDRNLVLMMRDHDENAIRWLIDAVGIDRLNEKIQRWGLSGTVVAQWLDLEYTEAANLLIPDARLNYLNDTNHTTSNDMIRLLGLFGPNGIFTSAYSDLALDYLGDESLDSIILLGDNSNSAVWHNAGQISPRISKQYAVYGDVGIVHTADGRIIAFAVYNHQNSDELVSINAISAVGRNLSSTVISPELVANWESISVLLASGWDPLEYVTQSEISKLESLQPYVRDRTILFVAAARTFYPDYNYIIGDAYRSAENQGEAHATGYSDLDGTDVMSNHQRGVAFDIWVVSPEGVPLGYRDAISGYERLGALGDELGFSWGGYWSFFDPFHFEITPELQLMQERFNYNLAPQRILSRTVDHQIYRVEHSDLLVISYASLRVQGLALDRMSYFIADGGQNVLSDSALAGRMFSLDIGRPVVVYEFTASQMADFYNAAHNQGVTLNWSETSLLDELISMGILAESNGRYSARENAAIVTVTDDIYDRYVGSDLEWLPESLYWRGFNQALYDTSLAYRELARSRWNNLSVDRRNAITQLLRDMGYDTSDDGEVAGLYVSLFRDKNLLLHLLPETVVPFYERQIAPFIDEEMKAILEEEYSAVIGLISGGLDLDIFQSGTGLSATMRQSLGAVLSMMPEDVSGLSVSVMNATNNNGFSLNGRTPIYSPDASRLWTMLAFLSEVEAGRLSLEPVELPQWNVQFIDENTPLPELVNIPEEMTNNRSGVQMRTDAFDALSRMFSAMRADGITPPVINSAYRGFVNQRLVFMADVAVTGSVAETAQRIAPPGYSEHHLGTAVDFGDVDADFAQSSQYAWMVQHAGEYGFVQTYTQEGNGVIVEPWHWRYNPTETGRNVPYVFNPQEMLSDILSTGDRVSTYGALQLVGIDSVNRYLKEWGLNDSRINFWLDSIARGEFLGPEGTTVVTTPADFTRLISLLATGEIVGPEYIDVAFDLLGFGSTEHDGIQSWAAQFYGQDGTITYYEVIRTSDSQIYVVSIVLQPGQDKALLENLISEIETSVRNSQTGSGESRQQVPFNRSNIIEQFVLAPLALWSLTGDKVRRGRFSRPETLSEKGKEPFSLNDLVNPSPAIRANARAELIERLNGLSYPFKLSAARNVNRFQSDWERIVSSLADKITSQVRARGGVKSVYDLQRTKGIGRAFADDLVRIGIFGPEEFLRIGLGGSPYKSKAPRVRSTAVAKLDPAIIAYPGFVIIREGGWDFSIGGLGSSMPHERPYLNIEPLRFEEESLSREAFSNAIVPLQTTAREQGSMDLPPDTPISLHEIVSGEMPLEALVGRLRRLSASSLLAFSEPFGRLSAVGMSQMIIDLADEIVAYASENSIESVMDLVWGDGRGIEGIDREFAEELLRLNIFGPIDEADQFVPFKQVSTGHSSPYMPPAPRVIKAKKSPRVEVREMGAPFVKIIDVPLDTPIDLDAIKNGEMPLGALVGRLQHLSDPFLLSLAGSRKRLSTVGKERLINDLAERIRAHISKYPVESVMDLHWKKGRGIKGIGGAFAHELLRLRIYGTKDSETGFSLRLALQAVFAFLGKLLQLIHRALSSKGRAPVSRNGVRHIALRDMRVVAGVIIGMALVFAGLQTPFSSAPFLVLGWLALANASKLVSLAGHRRATGADLTVADELKSRNPFVYAHGRFHKMLDESFLMTRFGWDLGSHELLVVHMFDPFVALFLPVILLADGLGWVAKKALSFDVAGPVETVRPSLETDSLIPALTPDLVEQAYGVAPVTFSQALKSGDALDVSRWAMAAGSQSRESVLYSLAADWLLLPVLYFRLAIKGVENPGEVFAAMRNVIRIIGQSDNVVRLSALSELDHSFYYYPESTSDIAAITRSVLARQALNPNVQKGKAVVVVGDDAAKNSPEAYNALLEAAPANNIEVFTKSAFIKKYAPAVVLSQGTDIDEINLDIIFKITKDSGARIGIFTADERVRLVSTAQLLVRLIGNLYIERVSDDLRKLNESLAIIAQMA